MSAISYNDIAQAIYLAGRDANDAEKFSKKVTQFLYRKRLLSKKDQILSNLNTIINKAEGVVEARVSSGKVLSEAAKRDVAHDLRERYNAKNISIIYKIDEGLLGGLRIEVKDEVIDFSIKNKMNKLQAYLTKD